MSRIVSALTVAVFVASAFHTTMGAQAPSRSVAQGVYTAAQADRGAPLYKEQCASCHGDNLEGSGPMPALTGPDFAKNWSGKNAADLFDKIHSTMPATAPGSLSEAQTADILAYIFKISQYPAGASELPSSADPLKQISLTASPTAATAGAGASPGAVGGAGAAPAAQPGASLAVSQGVYTAAQAKRGEPIYKEQCAACHGDNLEGSGPMPPLTGPDFARNWQGKKVSDLFEKTHSSMPATAPGSLTEQQTADVIAYIFSISNLPAGQTELAPSVEPLKLIVIDSK